MGIIRKIFVVFLLLSVFVLTGQTATDTVFFDGDIYVKHIVKAGESLKSIAKFHKVKTADIIDNNDLQKQLYYNQLLYIPIFNDNQYSSINSSDLIIEKQIKNSPVIRDTSVLNIALLMPYFLLKNYTMFKDFDDLKEISNIYYNGSEVALSFHAGLELALDSLRNQGKNICLYTFDTNKDNLKVHQIVNSKALENMDIIIGPLYSSNFKILCEKYGDDTSKVLISPLSKNTENVNKYKSVFQISPTFQVQADIIIKYVLKNHTSDRIIVINQIGNEGKSAYIKHLFNKQNKLVETFTLEYTNVDSIRKIFTEKQVVIIPSENKAFVSKILGSIGGMDSTSLVFGLSGWKKYDNLDINNLMFLDVLFPDPHYQNSTIKHDISFMNLFEKKYNTNQAKYSHIAYNIIMHFCSDFSLFQFKNIAGGGKVNTHAPLHHYIDYELVPAE